MSTIVDTWTPVPATAGVTSDRARARPVVYLIHAWRSRHVRADFVQVSKDPVGAGTRCSRPGGDRRDLAERLCQAGATPGGDGEGALWYIIAMALGVHACMWSVPTAISASAANLPISKR